MAIHVLVGGLQDEESPGVCLFRPSTCREDPGFSCDVISQIRLSALKAAAALIKYSDSRRVTESFAPLMLAVLEVLPSLAATKSQPRLSSAFVALIDLFSHRPAVRLLAPHLPTLIDFLVSLVADPSWIESVRHLAIEMLVTLAEQGGKVLFVEEQANGWVKVTRTLLELMSTVNDDPNWEFEEAVTSTEDDEQTSVVAEQALDRLALVGTSSSSSSLFKVRCGTMPDSTIFALKRREGRPSYGLFRHSCAGAIPVLARAPCWTFSPWDARRSMHRGHEQRAKHHDTVCLQFCSIPSLYAPTETTHRLLRPAFKDPKVRVQHAAIYALAQLATFFNVCGWLDRLRYLAG
jgi:Importin repeat